MCADIEHDTADEIDPFKKSTESAFLVTRNRQQARVVGVSMPGNLIIVAALGFLLGLTLRVGALIGATFVTAMASVAMGWGGNASASEIFLLTLETVVVLQCTYLAGLWFRALWRNK